MSLGTLSPPTLEAAEAEQEEEHAGDTLLPPQETREELAPLIRHCRLLLLSLNGGVVLAAAALLRRLLPTDQLQCIIKPLCRLTRSSRHEIAHCALEVVHALASAAGLAHLFVPQLTDFIASAIEPPVRTCKGSPTPD